VDVEISITRQTILTRDGIELTCCSWDNNTLNSDFPTPFFLLHGLASGLRIWDKVAVELLWLTNTPYVEAIDQRGHGLSEKPDTGYNTEQIVEDDFDFASASDLLVDRPIIVGHSWGATIALAYAATYPDKVSGLVLVDGGLGNMQDRPGFEDWERVAKELAPPDYAGTPKETFLDFYRKSPFLGPVWDAQLEDMVLNIVELRADDTVGPRLSRANHMQILRSLWEADNYALAEKVSCPVLMISAETTASPDAVPHNAQEASWLNAKRAGAQKLKAALVNSPRAEFVIMSNTIHDIPLQRPAELAKLIFDFFKV